MLSYSPFITDLLNYDQDQGDYRHVAESFLRQLADQSKWNPDSAGPSTYTHCASTALLLGVPGSAEMYCGLSQSRDCAHFFFGFGDSTIRVWDALTGRIKPISTRSYGIGVTVAISHNGGLSLALMIRQLE